MRLGNRSSNDFILTLNSKNDKIQEKYQTEMKEHTKTVPVKVMLGDNTITEQTSFDPEIVKFFYEKITKNLHDWTIQQISITNNEDLRRVFTKFEIRIGNYLLSGHMSLQYHVLLYYKSEYRVIECQKELSEIMDKTKGGEQHVAEIGDQLILEKLKEIGYKDVDEQKLFEIFFENDDLREKIYGEIEQKTDVNFQELSKRKIDLFNELDSYLIEIYQTSSVLIDDNRLVTGEEGCLCTFDLEFIKKQNKEGLFEPKKIPEDVKKEIIDCLEEFSKIMKV